MGAYIYRNEVSRIVELENKDEISGVMQQLHDLDAKLEKYISSR